MGPNVVDRVELDADVVEELRAALPSVAARTVAALTAEVAEYRGSIGDDRTATIETAVELSLATFLRMVTDEARAELSTSPLRPVLEAAYDLGRGEARAGRTMEALLAAYRVGARVAWQDESALLVRREVPAATVARFAQLVFAYIDELSGASAAGHRDELATSGRVREQLLERLARAMLTGEPAEQLRARAERADWPIPETVTAVVLRTAQLGNVVQILGPATLRLTADLAPGLPSDDLAVVLVPDAHRSRDALRSALAGRGAVIGPSQGLADVHRSYARTLRGLELLPADAETTIDTEDHLLGLVIGADADALHDLRTSALAPLANLRPATAARLADTLRSWLLHHGRRDDVAADLNVHPQTVRYRMTQLRELYGDRLKEPDAALELVVALWAPTRPSSSGTSTGQVVAS